ncbi:MAG TPA: hypothetical protein VFC78_05760 [Tepidisphaeraceae bacterium]|nr:hypothetical protein [Tepidisphaeraceae bacterium]
MHKRIAVLMAAASVASAGLLRTYVNAQTRAPAPPQIAPPVTAQAGAARTAADGVEVPIREVVLFSSGVGYFEHFGSVKGNGSAELRFKTDQINDVLKSLLLQDMDGGKVGTVSYAGQAPLARTLKSFGVDITANPTMADLLNQLRGARLTVSMASGRYTGTIVGVEKKVKAINSNGDAIETPVLNLKEGNHLRSIPLEETQSLELDDPKLQTELDEALGVVARSRDQDKKPVTIHFRGQGERRVRIGYVIETPVWKTSYRLVLADTDNQGRAGAQGDAKSPIGADQSYAIQPKPVAGAKANGAAKPNAGGSAKLQGWAIVENQTDNDWKDVELSLVSGRPLSFILDLYHSRYIARPIIQPQSYASLVPQTYAGGVTREEMEKLQKATEEAQARSQAPQGGGGIGANQVTQANDLFGGSGSQSGQAGRIDPTASIISAASAGNVGELFQYTIGNVSLARQQAAMIPIVTDDVDAEKLSIYNPGVLGEHPLLGARLKNNTKKFLLEGPITVLDQGRYAGDARIEDLPPGQQRLVSYGIDQQLLVDLTQGTHTSRVMTAIIVKGVLEITSRQISELRYLSDNKSNHAKTLIIEQARAGEDWKLVSPKEPDETTPEVYRFRRTIGPHKLDSLSVTTQGVSVQSIKLLSQTTDSLLTFFKTGGIPQNVRDALGKAIQMRSDLAALDAHLAGWRQGISDITAEQSRMRENMKTVSPTTDYYTRLVKKLDVQETDIEKAQKQIADTQKARDVLQKQFEDYLATLTIEAGK